MSLAGRHRMTQPFFIDSQGMGEGSIPKGNDAKARAPNLQSEHPTGEKKERLFNDGDALHIIFYCLKG